MVPPAFKMHRISATPFAQSVTARRTLRSTWFLLAAAENSGQLLAVGKARWRRALRGHSKEEKRTSGAARAARTAEAEVLQFRSGKTAQERERERLLPQSSFFFSSAPSAARPTPHLTSPHLTSSPRLASYPRLAPRLMAKLRSDPTIARDAQDARFRPRKLSGSLTHIELTRPAKALRYTRPRFVAAFLKRILGRSLFADSFPKTNGS